MGKQRRLQISAWKPHKIISYCCDDFRACCDDFEGYSESTISIVEDSGVLWLQTNLARRELHHCPFCGAKARQDKDCPFKRFMTRVQKDASGCWNWTGGISSKEYGKFTLNGRTIGAHRFSYQHYKGDIPKGYYVCHSCDNKLCVNPEHLWIGTPQDNMQDAIQKGRFKRGRKPRLSRDVVLAIEGMVKENPRIRLKEIATQYPMSLTTAHYIKTGQHVYCQSKGY